MKPNITLSLAKKLKVLLLSDDASNAQILENILKAERYQVDVMINNFTYFDKQVELLQPDIIIITIDSSDNDILQCLNAIYQVTPTPVVVFSKHDDQSMINKLVKSGVSSYLIGDIDYKRVKSIIDVALVRFSDYQSLKAELMSSKQKLISQKNIEKAKLWLMQSRKLSENDAYRFLRKTAMDNSQKIENVAKNVLAMASILSDT